MVLHIPKDVTQNKESIKNSLLQNPDILKVSYAQQVPGMIRNTSTYVDEGIHEAYRVQYVDPDYADLIEVKFADGRNHDWNRPADQLNAWVINETAMSKFQIPSDSVIGYQIEGWDGTPRTVIGVMKDFHFNSLQKEIVPLVFIWYENWAPKLHIKISSKNLNETIHYVHTVWKDFAPGYPFEYTFVDQEFNKHYQKEEKLSNIFTIFALLAIVIAAIGMYGLASYMAEKNSRQISIRKVYGASIKNILATFSKEFLYLVIIANIIAWPAAYYIMQYWINKFPYKTEMSVWIFILAGIISIIISLSTVIYNAYSTANRNPAEVLRYE
jgi:putative ABC transport system permease protein